MIDSRNLKKETDILNSEGTILGLYRDPKGNLYFGSLLKDGSGTVFYAVSENQLKDYLHSKMTLSSLYKESQSFLVKHKFRGEMKTYLKEDFVDSLQCGNDFYKNIPKSMKSKVIGDKYGI